jgi:hypothetical protein
MAGTKLCPVCGVVKRVNKEHEWLGNGKIVQRANPDHRMVFIEIENLSQMFSGVEDIIGMSIDRFIVEAKRRATFDFVDHTLPGIVKLVVRVVGMVPVIRNITALGIVMGYGNINLVSVKHTHSKESVVRVAIKYPYSVPLFRGDLAGSFNAIRRREVATDYEEIAPDEFIIIGRISQHPLELQERLQAKAYPHKPGDIAIEECPECGGPMMLSEYRWDLSRGIIENKERGRRMVLLGPAALEAVTDDLEKELGDTIPHVIVEAERRFIETGFYTVDEVASEELFRTHLAARGLGNMRDLEWREDGLRFRLENPCLVLVVVGMALGFFELASGREGHARWERSEDGDLLVDISS